MRTLRNIFRRKMRAFLTCDRTIVMRDGVVVDHGTGAVLSSPPIQPAPKPAPAFEADS